MTDSSQLCSYIYCNVGSGCHRAANPRLQRSRSFYYVYEHGTRMADEGRALALVTLPVWDIMPIQGYGHATRRVHVTRDEVL